MLKLDGNVLNLSDRVYDLVNGYGDVTDITNRGFTVTFYNRRRITFEVDGTVGNTRRIFWHDPLILAPPKDPAEWNNLIRLVISVQALITSPPTP